LSRVVIGLICCVIIVYLFVRVIQTVVAGARVGIRGFFCLICLQNAAFSFFVVCQDHVRMEVNFSLEEA
jgi:hypothetical protein